MRFVTGERRVLVGGSNGYGGIVECDCIRDTVQEYSDRYLGQMERCPYITYGEPVAPSLESNARRVASRVLKTSPDNGVNAKVSTATSQKQEPKPESGVEPHRTRICANPRHSNSPTQLVLTAALIHQNAIPIPRSLDRNLPFRLLRTHIKAEFIALALVLCFSLL